MTLRDAAQWLLDNSYLTLVNGRPVVTAKMERELGYIAPVEETSVPATPSIPQDSGEAMKRLTDPKDVWNAFIHDCEIPHRVKASDGGTYTVRQYGASVAKKLQKIIQDPKIEYWRLVEATKNYYKTTSYKALLSNYIDKGIWAHEYNEWDSNKPKQHVNDGGSRWED